MAGNGNGSGTGNGKANGAARKPITVLIVDDERTFGEALEVAMDREKDLRVIHVATDGQEAVALATDVNPGGGISPSMPFAMALACFAMGMTFEEALAAATINAASSLDVADRVGSLEPGKQFDAVLVDGPAINLLRLNASPIAAVFKKGVQQ